MSKRSRRQTRSRRFDLNWTCWPIHHNAEVALRKEEKRILRGGYLAPPAPARTAHPKFVLVVAADELPAWWRESRRTEIVNEYRRLDSLAGRGWDVRDEMNALAAEEAELTRAEL